MERPVGEIEKVLDLLRNRDCLNFDEKYIKILLINLVFLTQLHIKSKAKLTAELPALMYLFRKPYYPTFPIFD